MRCRWAAAVDCIDQHCHPENIGQQDKFLAPCLSHRITLELVVAINLTLRGIHVAAKR
jgi:hypothetical protein